MNMQQLLHTADSISTWVGKAFAWLIVALMLMVVVEVFKRYILNAPTAWIFDASNMMYGTLFMMGGAYTLSQDGHVRGDFFYGSAQPRTLPAALSPQALVAGTNDRPMRAASGPLASFRSFACNWPLA